MLRKGRGVINRVNLNRLLGIPDDAVIIEFKNIDGDVVVEYYTNATWRTIGIDDIGAVRRYRMGENSKSYMDIDNDRKED